MKLNNTFFTDKQPPLITICQIIFSTNCAQSLSVMTNILPLNLKCSSVIIFLKYMIHVCLKSLDSLLHTMNILMYTSRVERLTQYITGSSEHIWTHIFEMTNKKCKYCCEKMNWKGEMIYFIYFYFISWGTKESPKGGVVPMAPDTPRLWLSQQSNTRLSATQHNYWGPVCPCWPAATQWTKNIITNDSAHWLAQLNQIYMKIT